ncbi:hypothetical protein [Pedobacter psychroterrae]|uniref:Uncharacterized protein n=1 Tax=Pedobacter psychroterrae TaxID=2530453 RepID=A0A4R0NKE4_9SPHI|nr:hypothetical protein [Pedobacter psychroterrae]TCC99962.1 hypothetical protein EZ437_17130 [Pedobacter psychroterrae]
MKRIILSVTFVFALANLHGQAKIDFLSLGIKTLNLNYTPLERSVELQSIMPDDNYVPRPNSGILNGFDYKMKPAEDDVVIVFSFFDSDTVTRKRSTKFSYNDTDHIEKINYLIYDEPIFYEDSDGTVRRIGRSTTLNPKKAYIFKGQKLKRYGADDAALFDVPVSRAYQGKYHKLKVFCMYKKNEGEVWIYYFYNEGAKIDKHIRDTEYILTFKKR